MYTVDIHHIQPSDWEPGYYVEPIYKIEEFNLFPCLKEHLPVPALWNNYDEWREKFFDYVDVCYKVIHDIRRIDKQIIDLNVLRILDGLEYFFLDCIQYINAWKGILERDTGDWRDIVECQAGKHKPRKFHFEIIGEIGRQTLEADGYRVLEAENVFSVIKPFQSFANNFLGGEDVTKLKTLYCELRDLERQIWKSLDEIMIRCDYIKHTCSLCPRQ